MTTYEQFVNIQRLEAETARLYGECGDLFGENAVSELYDTYYRRYMAERDAGKLDFPVVKLSDVAWQALIILSSLVTGILVVVILRCLGLL
jgi:hypothetical protein